MRSLHVDDAELVEELEYYVFPTDNMGAYLLARELEAGGGYILQAEGGRGYILFRDCGIRDILRIGVEEGARGQGFGEMLLLTALIGIGDAMLTVRKWNKPALRLYAKHGFRVIADDLSNSWVMRRLHPA